MGGGGRRWRKPPDVEQSGSRRGIGEGWSPSKSGGVSVHFWNVLRMTTGTRGETTGDDVDRKLLLGRVNSICCC